MVRDWSSNDKVVEWCDDKVWVLSDNMMEIVGSKIDKTAQSK